MTRTEKLDAILISLLAVDYYEQKNESINKKITMEFINSTNFNSELLDWEMKSLKDDLLNEELIIESINGLTITQKGKKFITREQGFKNIEKIANQENTIREKTIEKFRYDKFSFWISVIAIIISLLSLLWTILELEWKFFNN